MASMSDYLENKLIDFLFRGNGGSFVAPTALYIGLLTAAPSDSSAGTEVSGGSYARVSYAPNTTNWANTQNSGTGVSSGTGGTTQNLVAVTFAAPSANWGTVTHWGIYDASSAGNLLFWAALTASKVVNNGDAAPSFAIGALTVQIDN